MNDFKIGINLWSQGTSWDELLDAGKAVDRLGYEHLWTWDHVKAIFGDPNQPIFEGWTAVTAWAMATERVKVGLMVGANTFRNPALVAKIVTTLDHASGGRAILASAARGSSSSIVIRDRIREQSRAATRLARRVGRRHQGARVGPERDLAGGRPLRLRRRDDQTRCRSRSGSRS